MFTRFCVRSAQYYSKRCYSAHASVDYLQQALHNIQQVEMLDNTAVSQLLSIQKLSVTETSSDKYDAFRTNCLKVIKRGFVLLKQIDDQFVRNEDVDQTAREKISSLLTIHEANFLTTRGVTYLHMFNHHTPRQHKEFMHFRKLAMQDLEQAMYLDPENERPLHTLATIYYGASLDEQHHAQNITKAFEYVDRAIKLVEEKHKDALAAKKKKERGVEKEDVLNIDPTKNYLTLYSLRAQILSSPAMGRFTDACDDITVALTYAKLQPNSDAQQAQLLLQRAIYIKKNFDSIQERKKAGGDVDSEKEQIDPQQCLKDLQDAMRLAPKSLYPLLHRAIYYRDVEMDTRKAMNDLVRFKNWYGSSENVVENKKEKEQMLARLEGMVKNLQSSVNRDLHAEQSAMCTAKAREMRDMHDYRGAYLEFTKAIALVPNVVLYMERAYVGIEEFKQEKQRQKLSGKIINATHSIAKNVISDVETTKTLTNGAQSADIALLEAHIQHYIYDDLPNALELYSKIIDLGHEHTTRVAQQQITIVNKEIAKRKT